MRVLVFYKLTFSLVLHILLRHFLNRNMAVGVDLFAEFFARFEMHGVFGLSDELFAGFRIVSATWWAEVQVEAAKTPNLNATALAQISLMCSIY